MLYLRSQTWGRSDLSWSRVMERLLHGAEQLGHKASLLSTNGYDGMSYWSQERAAKTADALLTEMAGRPFDVDVTYAIPTNFVSRFERNSRVKVGRYDYESSIMPTEGKLGWNIPDYIVASSQYVADIFENNGAPISKLRVVNSGVDRSLYRESEKSASGIKILCVAEPHYRKQLDRLLTMYCAQFSAADDVTLILKTRLFHDGQKKKNYEQDIRPVLAKLRAQYGESMANIKIITGFCSQEQMAKLYQSCHIFALPTTSEGWGMPFLEAMACGCLVVAPRFGGQLEFLSDDNALLADTSVRLARPQEQYGCTIVNGKPTLNGTVGNPNEEHFGLLLRSAVENYSALKAAKAPAMQASADKFTWMHAAAQLISLAD